MHSMTVAATESSIAPAPAPANLQAADQEQWDLIIRPRKGWIGVDFAELFSHRELLLFLIWRDVKVKYKQAILGFAWAVLVPVLQVMVFTMIGKFAGSEVKLDDQKYMLVREDDILGVIA